MLRAEAGANILTNDGTLLRNRWGSVLCLNANPSQYSPAVEYIRDWICSLAFTFSSDLCLLACQQLEPLTSADGRFCVCTVPSLRPSRRARFSAPPPLLPLPSRSYWPRLQSTVGPPGTANKVEIELAIKRVHQSFSSPCCHGDDSATTIAHRYPFSLLTCQQIIYFLILSGGLTCPTDPFPLYNLSHKHFFPLFPLFNCSFSSLQFLCATCSSLSLLIHNPNIWTCLLYI